jgi:hypothetical protein
VFPDRGPGRHRLQTQKLAPRVALRDRGGTVSPATELRVPAELPVLAAVGNEGHGGLAGHPVPMLAGNGGTHGQREGRWTRIGMRSVGRSARPT